MKSLIAAFILFSFSQANADTPRDMIQLCSVEDGTLNNPGDFPRWLPQLNSSLFVSFDNLTSRYGDPHKECERVSTISGDHLENDGQGCDFATEEGVWTVHLNGKISGTVERQNGIEVTRFDSGFTPKFEWRYSDGKVMIANDLTRLCRRQINGKFTDEIILEMQDRFEYHSYVILDGYPSNI
jgi:hypothetical protein